MIKSSHTVFLYLFMLWLYGISHAPNSMGQGNNILLDEEKPLKVDLKPTDVIHWQPVVAETGDHRLYKVILGLSTEQEFAIYADKVSFKSPDVAFEIIDIKPPTPFQRFDEIENKEVSVYDRGEFHISLKAHQNKPIKSITINVTFLGCTARICLFPFTEELQVPVHVASTPQIPQSTTLDPVRAEPSLKPIASPSPNLASDWESSVAQIIGAEGAPLTLLLSIVFVAGLLTNLTPCVYPMIPITVRSLANQGAHPIAGASFYALGIMTTYTALGVIAAVTGSLFGNIFAYAWVNFFLAAIFISLAASMVGAFNFSFIQNMGMKIAAAESSLWNAYLMGAGAGFVASPCTGPVMASLLTLTAQSGNLSRSVLLLFIYSLGFSLPYVFLGSIAARVAHIRVRHEVQLLVKVGFAGIMITLALYYLRIPFYQQLKDLAPYWPMLTVSISLLTIGICAYVNQSYVRAHAVPWLFTCAMFIGTALFTSIQWASTTHLRQAHLTWISSLEEGKERAQKEQKPILIDAWAAWCEACLKMDRTTFTDKTLHQVLEDWIIIKLDLTAETKENSALQEYLGVTSLPTLTLIPYDFNLAKKQSINGYVNAENLMRHLHEFKKGN